MTRGGAMRELNFDGIIGPTHNYAGLSLGNLASASHAGQISHPRKAALQGLGKMRLMMSLGFGQGFFLPQERPDVAWLERFGFTGSREQICAAAWREDPALFAASISASSMWAANAATVSPAPDTADGRVHLTPANLYSMKHRSHEWLETQAQLFSIFPDERYFAVHNPVPGRYGDEGAANFMRLAPSAEKPGVEVMVYGEPGGPFPARQSAEACRAIFRLHGVAQGMLARQSDEAIAAGAFHNDVVAVAHENILFAHEKAFAEKDALYAALTAGCAGLTIIEVAERDVPLADAIRSYLFNSQLVTLPDGSRALIVPMECMETPSVKAWLDRHIGFGPIDAVHVVEVRESMNNGGGPACLRLRVLVSEEAEPSINPTHLLSDRSADRSEAVIAAHWPDQVGPADLGTPDYWQQTAHARAALIAAVQALA
jgi:succinylarginine dihydrolase